MNVQRDVYTRLLKTVCEREGVAYEAFSGDWFFRLTRGGRTRYIYDHLFPLNDAAARAISHDKSAAYDIMTLNGVACVEHKYFTGGAFAMEDVYSLLNKYKRLVIKKNTGTGGRDIFDCADKNETDRAAGYLTEQFGCFAVSPYREIDAEYRVVLLDGGAEVLYKKIRRAGEWRHNLQWGAVPEVIGARGGLYDEIINLAVDAAGALNLRFASVDVILCGAALMVLEINAGVMMEYFASFNEETYKIAGEVYAKAVRAMFEFKRAEANKCC